MFCLWVGIQQYLFENNRIDNIFTDFYYDRFTDCLNEILSTYQVSLNSQGLFLPRETLYLKQYRTKHIIAASVSEVYVAVDALLVIFLQGFYRHKFLYLIRC